jgi:hypothetical protein
MALRPDLVQKDAFPAALPKRTGAGGPTPTVIRAGESLGTGPGYTDDPSEASPEAGERYLAAVAGALKRFLVDFHKAHPVA